MTATVVIELLRLSLTHCSPPRPSTDQPGRCQLHPRRWQRNVHVAVHQSRRGLPEEDLREGRRPKARLGQRRAVGALLQGSPLKCALPILASRSGGRINPDLAADWSSGSIDVAAIGNLPGPSKPIAASTTDVSGVLASFPPRFPAHPTGHLRSDEVRRGQNGHALNACIHLFIYYLDVCSTEKNRS